MTAADLSFSAPAVPAVHRRLRYSGLVHAAFAIFIFCGCVSFIEPSPYDFMFVLVAPMWFVAGFRVPRSSAPILALWLIYNLAGFISLMPFWGDHDARLFEFQSLYLILTVIFFTIFFSDKTEQRLELCLKAYTGGAIFASVFGILGYLNVGGLAAIATMDEGRLSGTFKDANVLGSYLILSAVFLVQGIVLGTSKRIFLSLLASVVIFIAIFLAFSRGSWGAAILALFMMIAMGFITAKSRRERRRIVKVAAAVLAVGVVAVLLVLADPAIRDMLLLRASLLHSYDVGETGRFGNQLRSLPMLLELPNGFGPLRFRDVFGLEPHNSYINAFASYGWLGGFCWLIIVGMTMWVGFRLCFSPSPYRRLAQVYWPALFVVLLQGFQIDIDHWRQLFLCFGAVWGMEAARLKWLRGRAVALSSPSLRAEGDAIQAR